MRSIRARANRRQLGFEPLEIRLALSATHGSLAPVATHVDAAKKHVGSSYPYGLTPDQTRAYYGFDQVSFGGAAADGTGQTIAIITVGNDPNMMNDLATFDRTFGIADPPHFQMVNQLGGTKLAKKNKSWASETALDVEWAHAIAPGADILLVEAKSDSLSNFITAIDFARHVPGVTVVSISAAGDEFSSETTVDPVFTTPAGHAGVTFVFATGDEGGTAEYPASSPNVLSVGGTTLGLTYPAQWNQETAWSDGGGGASLYEGVPSYQNGLGLTTRGTPDVSYDADPYSGFAVLDSYSNRGWGQYGGTSAGTPQWAALIAIVNQGRQLAGKTPLAGAQAALYAMPSSDFHDIATGDNQQHSASNGYDLATGVGSPIADQLIPDMVAFSGSTAFTVSLPPAVAQSGKTKHHFTTGVEVVTAPTAYGGVDAGTGTLKGILASSLDLAYADETRSAAALMADDVPLTPPAPLPQARASSKARLGSATRGSKVAKASDDGLAHVDAFFAGLGESLAAT